MKHDAPIDGIRDALRRADARLDDVTRARMLAGIRARIEEDADAFVAQRPARSRVVFLTGLAALAATAAAVVLIFSVMSRGARHRDASPAQVAAADLVPYLYEGSSAYPLGESAPAVTLAAGSVLRASVGDSVRLTLHGPAALAAAPGPAEQTTLRLDRGLLIVEYRHQVGRSLAIQTPDAVTIVTGTLLAVEAEPAASTRVSVARGAVVVEPRDGTRMALGAGQSWRVGDSAAVDMAGEVRTLFAEHDATMMPPAGETGLLHVDGAPRGAVAWLGQERLGRIPLVARVPAGEARVRIEAEGHRSIDTSAKVPAGEAREVTQTLSPLAPRASARPGDGDGGARPPARPLSPRTVPGAGAVPGAVAGADADAVPVAGAGDGTAPPVPATAEDMYRLAEDAIARGDRARARTVLHDLITRHPDDPLVDVALYELGRLAFDQDKLRESRKHLERVIARGRDPVFVEPARYLRCRVEVAAGPTPEAIPCLERFRRQHPGSPHDAEALALLAALHHARNHCEAALPLLREYLRRYPGGPFAAEAMARIERCR